MATCWKRPDELYLAFQSGINKWKGHFDYILGSGSIFFLHHGDYRLLSRRCCIHYHEPSLAYSLCALPSLGWR
jgi:hypothetical protein